MGWSRAARAGKVVLVPVLTFSRILCPVDFSDASSRALTYTTALANWRGARLDRSNTQHVVRTARYPVLTVRG
jgi:hypothetical protein